ncbi:N-acetyltransferase [Bacillus sp. FJAT-29790]|uniref:acyltransferase n=1 Tax=Bacillus sp. FJAT-29790 TaxID=1895002 RepID=UPI001C221C7D|nr:N-acetyltransferase [Bacillus sp. FJAT-29790]MBU8880785.1 N-acetyltransferase [Bacillus sp. FJAT-29790]
MSKKYNIGNNVVIGENVKFGRGVTIGNNVVIYEGCEIGNDTVILDNAVIGKQPTAAKNSIRRAEMNLKPTVIGAGCTIGTSAIIYANAIIANDVFIADLATVRERVSIGEKTIIGRGVAVENDCKIGSKCKLETNCYITAYSDIEDFVFIAPNVVTTNDNYMSRTKERLNEIKGVTIKKGGRVGANATILPGKVIHEDGAVAAGSVVTKDVKAKQIVAGIPAKELKAVPAEQLLINQ